MSLRALLWVMEDAPVISQGELAVLYALAERANDQGKCAWPSQAWIAGRARCTDRTVRNHLRALEGRGLIKKGNPQFVAHISPDRRPTVWDLDMSLKRPENERAENSSGRKVATERPESCDRTTGKLRQNDRKPVSDKASGKRPEPSGKRPGPHQLPEDWKPSEKAWKRAKETYPMLDLDAVLRDFKFYWHSQEGSRALKRDWGRTWSNWLMNEAKWSKDKPGSSTGASKPDIRKMLDEIVAQEDEVDESAPF